jgi:membrane protease YdiL (CAAX protease family)
MLQSATPLLFPAQLGVNWFAEHLSATLLDSFEPIPPSQPEPLTPLEPVASQAPENPVFNLTDVVLIVVVAVASLVFCTLIALIVISAQHPFRGDVKELAGNVLVFLPAQLVAYILTVGFMVFLTWHRYRTRFLEAVHWNMPPAKLAWGALAAGAGLALVTQLLSGLLQRWMPKSLPIEEYFRTPASAYALAAFGILVAPVVEELFFRGFLYPALERPLEKVFFRAQVDSALARPLGVATAMALTAAGFALIHSVQLAHAWAPLLVLFGVGIVLTAVRAKTKSVATCVLIHMGYNFTLFMLVYIVTQGFRHMERA